MIKNILFFCCICFQLSSLFGQITDDFLDGNFTSNPAWIGDVADFQILNNQLNSISNIANDTFYLSTASTVANDAQWDFWVNFQFNTSSANFVDVYLISDQNNLKANNINGYFVRIGGTADEICLFKRSGALNTATKIIDGIDGSTNKSNNTINIKVKRSISDLWTLERDTTGGTNYFAEGTAIDNTFNSSVAIGIYIRQSTASFFGKHFFDNFYAGNIILDVAPPEIVSATAISANQVDVLFNENVTTASAQIVNNYSVNNGIGNPTQALLDAGNNKLVHLSFGNNFTNNTNYGLQVQNVEDLNGNVMSLNAVGFTYLIFEIPAFGEVIINELFPDPTPPVGLPESEFVEIYNKSNKIFNLQGWKLKDPSSSATLPNYVLFPNQYLIICANADTNLYKVYGPTKGVASFPSLNNTSDAITLEDNVGNKIDEIAYDIAWYGNVDKDDGGYTLELINPFAPCGSSSANWRASDAAIGGTPGTQNSVFDISPDTISPALLSMDIIANDSIELIFSELMNQNSLLNGSYSLNNGLTFVQTAVLPNQAKVALKLSGNIDPSLIYTITVNNVSDCSGNLISQLNTIDFGIGVPPEKFEIVFNEIHAIPNSSTILPNAEFVELYNRTNKLINLNGFKFSDRTSVTTINNAIIPAFGYLIVCGSSSLDSLNIYGKAISVSSFPSLNNSDDLLTLRKPNGEIIHQVEYFDTWFDNIEKEKGGWSLEMIDPNNPCGEANNWKASVDNKGGTPGAQNSVFGNNPDNDAPQLVSVFAIDTLTVEVNFNEIADSLSLLNANYEINNSIFIDAIFWQNSKQVILKLTNSLQPNIFYKLTINGCSDCVGNVSANLIADFILPAEATKGDIIINEVLFNPKTGGSDFVEVYNNSAKYINLKNWKLANFDIEEDTLGSVVNISDKNYVIQPQQYLVLTKDVANVQATYPRSLGRSFIVMSSTPSYNDSEGNVILISNRDSVMERLDYFDAWHFPLLDDKNGVSLERLDFNRAVSDPSNWHSASKTEGYATPGYLNSQFIPSEFEDNDVLIEPKIFSPDNDGYNDLVNISYQFASNGNIGNITIFDSNGTIVRYLVKNELLGFQGIYTWNGINENQQRLPSGIYVVLFETFDTSGDVKKFKKTVVLADRL